MTQFKKNYFIIVCILGIFLGIQSVWSTQTHLEILLDKTKEQSLSLRKIVEKMKDFLHINLPKFPDDQLKKFNEAIQMTDPIFDSWISFLLESQKHDLFPLVLKQAYEKALQKDSTAFSKFNLFHMLKEGKGVEKNDQEALKWLSSSADQGFAPAQHRLGYDIYWLGKQTLQDYQKALRWLSSSADQGFALAQTDLALMYFLSKHSKKDMSKILKYLTLAANQNFAIGQNNLGMLYTTGEVKGKNDTDGIILLTSTAHKGLALAQKNLIYLHSQEGYNKNLSKSLYWYARATEHQLDTLNEIKFEEVAKTLIHFPLQDIENPSITNRQAISDHFESFILDFQNLLKCKDIESKISDSNLFPQKKSDEISALKLLYEKVVKFKSHLLDLLPYLKKPDFMITCLQPKDETLADLKSGTLAKVHFHHSYLFLSFGVDNIQTADKIISIIQGKNLDLQSLVSQLVETEIKIYEALNLSTNEDYLDSVSELSQLPDQLSNVLIKSRVIRNKKFLETHPFFQN